MAFPLFFVTAAFALGVGLASAAGVHPASAAAGTGVILAAAWASFALRKTGASLGLLLAAAALLGAGVFAAADASYEANGLRRLPPGSYLDITGTAYRSASPGIDRDLLYIRTESIRLRDQETPVRGRLRISVLHSAEGARLPDITVGDRLRIAAQIVPPRDYVNFDEPFSRTYLKTRRLHATASTKSPLLVQVLNRGCPLSPRRWMSLLRRSLVARIEHAFAAPGAAGGISREGAIFEALILGERSRLDEPTTRGLQGSGLYHLFAISGAHVGIVSLLLFGLFRTLRIPRRSSLVLLLASLVFYGFLVEGRASVARAVVMAAVFLLGRILWKDAHPLNAIAASGLGLLIVNPHVLLEAGFQLTFAAALALILFVPKIMGALPALPLRTGEMLAFSAAAQIGVMPIMAAVFHRVVFSGLLLNLIGIPLVGLLMGLGIAYLALGFVLPFLAGPGATLIALLVRVFLASSRLLDGLPFLSFRIPTPPAWAVGGYYVFLALWLLPSRMKKSRRVAAAGFAVAFAVLAIHPFPSTVRDLTVTVLDVGQGDSILVEFPGRSKMLVDGGGLPIGTFDVGESVVSPFLWNKGIRRIDRLVLTHAHPDHLRGLEAVARNFRIGEFLDAVSPSGNAAYDRLLEALGKTPRRKIRRGHAEHVAGVDIETLSPGPEAADADNDASVVLRLSTGATAFLLTGDIGSDLEAELLSLDRDLRAQVLKAPHHGSRFSGSDAFLEAVRPEIVIVSAGGGSVPGLPHAEALARYAATGARLFRTDLHGAVETRSDGRTIFLRTAR